MSAVELRGDFVFFFDFRQNFRRRRIPLQPLRSRHSRSRHRSHRRS
jgi:hypothetical protein